MEVRGARMPRPGRRVPGAFGPFARALECHYGCTRAQVAFWHVHEQAAREHGAIADHIVVRLASTGDLQEAVGGP
jgi:hypothetical protein